MCFFFFFYFELVSVHLFLVDRKGVEIDKLSKKIRKILNRLGERGSNLRREWRRVMAASIGPNLRRSKLRKLYKACLNDERARGWMCDECKDDQRAKCSGNRRYRSIQMIDFFFFFSLSVYLLQNCLLLALSRRSIRHLDRQLLQVPVISQQLHRFRI